MVILFFISGLVWFIGANNPETPAGYVGYLTQGVFFGQAKFYGLQTGPTSPGRTHTTIYLPVGPMGVPIVGTLDMGTPKQSVAETVQQKAGAP